MKPETLHALVIDRELGELSLEASELLEAYLAAVPSAASQAGAVARTVSTARETMHRYPELAPRASRLDSQSPRLGMTFRWAPKLARAAALIAIAGSCIWAGYRAGTSTGSGHPSPGRMVDARPRFEGLWTQYQVAYDDQRQTFAAERRR